MVSVLASSVVDLGSIPGIHNEVRDFDKNSTQPEIRVNRIRDNESQLYKDNVIGISLKCIHEYLQVLFVEFDNQIDC
jgi:hypothetical protein